MRGSGLLYLDSSALVKLSVREPQTPALVSLTRRWPERVSSVLARVEVPRALRRAGVGRGTIANAEEILRRIALIRLRPRIVSLAAEVAPPALRALDAIHLATAVWLGDALGGVVTYDRRLAAAALATGLEVMAPA